MTKNMQLYVSTALGNNSSSGNININSKLFCVCSYNQDAAVDQTSFFSPWNSFCVDLIAYIVH